MVLKEGGLYGGNAQGPGAVIDLTGAGAGSGDPRGGAGRGAWISRARGQRPSRGRGQMRGGERFFAHIKCYNCNEMGHYANQGKA